MSNAGLPPSFSNFTYIQPNVWRSIEVLNGIEVAFDIRAYDFDGRKVALVNDFFRKVKTNEIVLRQIIVKDIVSSDEWARWCGVPQPEAKALMTSMKLVWVIASDDPKCDYNFVLNYETPLFEGFEVGGWFDFDGRFKFAEIE